MKINIAITLLCLGAVTAQDGDESAEVAAAEPEVVEVEVEAEPEVLGETTEVQVADDSEADAP
jgi:hypothetical protein